VVPNHWCHHSDHHHHHHHHHHFDATPLAMPISGIFMFWGHALNAMPQLVISHAAPQPAKSNMDTQNGHI